MSLIHISTKNWHSSKIVIERTIPCTDAIQLDLGVKTLVVLFGNLNGYQRHVCIYSGKDRIIV